MYRNYLEEYIREWKRKWKLLYFQELDFRVYQGADKKSEGGIV